MTDKKEKIISRLAEWSVLVKKKARTAEEEARYNYLKENYYPPLKEEELIVYDRICNESESCLNAKESDMWLYEESTRKVDMKQRKDLKNMNSDELWEEMMELIGEYRRLKKKQNRTKEEEERYNYLKKEHFPPPTRYQRQMFDRWMEEGKGCLTAKKVDMK